MGGGYNGCELGFKEEFQKANFLLHHNEPHRFWQSEWHRSPKGIEKWYVLYRIFWGAWHLVWCVINFLYTDQDQFGGPFINKLYFFIYLTNWSYILITVCTVFHACLVTKIYYYQSLASTSGSTLTIIKLIWVLQNLTSFPAIFITTTYWSLIYDPDSDPLHMFNATKHMVNSMYVLMELGVSAWPVRILHFIYPLALAMVYSFFALIYYLAGGTTETDRHYIYVFLNYENLGLTIPFIFGSFIAAPFLQSLVWLIYKARINVRQACLGHHISRKSTTVKLKPADTTTLHV